MLADIFIYKNGYANSLFYTTTFPISRISLVLLYKRVFVKEWLRYVCWFLIASYAGYSISTVFVDAFGVLPVAANWDKNITVAHTIDWKKLVFGNCVFNIITDLVLLVLPLTVIWILKMSKWARLGLSFVFSLGVLTLIASIMRCYYSFVYDKQDPDCEWSLSFSFVEPDEIEDAAPIVKLMCSLQNPSMLTHTMIIRLHGDWSLLDTDRGLPRSTVSLPGNLSAIALPKV